MKTPKPMVRIAPDSYSSYSEAVLSGGGRLVFEDEAPEVLLWSRHGAADELANFVKSTPSLKWVQLPSAGVEDFFRTGAVETHPDIIWTSAKGAYAEPVAEHAHALILALLRMLHVRARSTTWGTQAGETLHGKRILIIGGGGIAKALARVLSPYSPSITIIRRHLYPVANTDQVLGMEHLHRQLPLADIIVLAAALTPETFGMLSETELSLMRPEAYLVNVARGGLVVTDDLVAALTDRSISGAALDVTDPEPLPDGHPLWTLENAIVTPHTADTMQMIIPLLAHRIRENLMRFRSGQRLLGIIDPDSGY